MNAPLFYAARPVLKLDGTRERSLEEGLLSLVVEETAEGMASCELGFANWGTKGGSVGFLYFGRDVLEFGRKLEVEGTGGPLFSGRISGLEGRFPKSRPPEVTVLAEDGLQALRMTRRSRTFEDVDLSQLVQAIASDHGLTPQADAESPTWRVAAQLNQSDLAFLREMARAADAEIWVEDGKLHAASRASRAEGERALTYGRELHEFSVTADLAGQCSRLTVGGWDVAAKEALEGEAGPSSLGAEAEGDSGAEVLDATLGERPDSVVHALPMTTAEADALAAAHFRRRARRFLRGEAVAEGDAKLRVGAKVAIRGCGPLFDGAYVIAATRHSFDLEQGFRSRLTLERPWIGSA